MTLSEIASYLKVAEKTVLRMIQKDEIPCVKIASQWRFDKGLIDQWIISKMHRTETDELTTLMQKDADSVPLSRLTAEDFILTDLPPGDPETLLSELSKPLLDAGLISDHKDFVAKLISRENMISTSLGRGVAMPHIRNPKENPSSRPVVVVGICREGIEFDAPDGQPAKVFFLIYTNNEIAHLRIISKINSFLRNNDVINDFLTVESPKDVIRILLKE
ncbi:MAG: PTS sugar transporter subunit IIA [Spirochaetales bacterium]|uniref:PTS sugar transporter subunit IIA n=1 Tax=Candidatus Thalassospirochaeta sargassi TaxID=3119039 RepID=A0AAJ1IA89_9SPIO|nr:PTS sugar transporter subunit IIA [Spirochaetales bacterium]